MRTIARVATGFECGRRRDEKARIEKMADELETLAATAAAVVPRRFL
jgi:hypothetical protein